MTVHTQKQPLDVTQAEAQLIKAFRAMNDDSQIFTLKFAEIFSGKNPRPKRPALRLVSGVKS